MTNRLKRHFPGDSYKFWVDVGTMFYDRVYKVVNMGLRAWNRGRLVLDSELPRLLVAMGASGNRYYGSHKSILPNEHNCIAISQTSLFRKLILKGSIEHGKHDHIRELTHFTADKLQIDYHESIPLQCDGETTILAKCDFPLEIEKLQNAYNVLVPV